MMNYFQNMMTSGFYGLPFPMAGWWFFPLIVWSAVGKGIALWRAVRSNHLGWFVAIFLLNTVGILEIIYLVAFAKKK